MHQRVRINGAGRLPPRSTGRVTDATPTCFARRHGDRHAARRGHADATRSYYGSIYPSVQNLLLAARAAGLGAALITLPLWSTFLARRALGLPWSVAPCAVIPMGWPRGKYGPTTRRPVGEVVHVDRYGNQPFRRD